MALQPMYPGMVNSPQTELASAIDDQQTMITLLDASVLPDPPNICTIGTGEDAETVLYTGKSGNDLINVTRGFQGTARSWSAGAKVARNFTAYDYDAMRQNVETIQRSIPIGTKFRDIPEPFYIAHRGGANIFPENTIEAYEGCLALGIIMIEQDCRKLLDGSLAVIHDSTVDRVTGKTGNVADFTTMAWKNLNITGVLPGWKDVPAVLFDEVLQRFGNRAVYVPESKDQACVPDIVAALKRHNLTEYALIQSFSLSDLQAAVIEGIPAMFLTSNENTTPQTIKDAGVEYVGVSTTVSDAYISSLISEGLKVVVWTVNRRYQRDHYLSLGVSGFFSDDPLYLSGRSPVLRKDPFANAVYFHGNLAVPAGPVAPDNPVVYGGNRGVFVDGRFGWPTAEYQVKDVSLQGWAEVLPETFTIHVDITYEAPSPGDGAAGNRWPGVAFCHQIDYFDDNGPNNTGYNLIYRPNGSLELYRIDPGEYNNSTRIAIAAVDQWLVGQTKSLVIVVEGSYIKVSLGGQEEIVVEDDTYRGGYLSLLRNYLGATFSNITID